MRAYNIDSGEHLEFIPSDRFTALIDFQLPEAGKFKNNTLNINALHVAKQGRIKASQDFAAVPPAYSLLNLDFSTSVLAFGNQLTIGLSVQNMLNTRYRDYLNRFRYYADDTGRNVVLRLKMPFGKNNITTNN